MAKEEHAIAQQDELDSLVAIFADDFSLLSSVSQEEEGPISYSIRLRPVLGDGQQINTTERPPDDLALTVAYPPTYPHDAIPIFSIICGGSSRLHVIQERALLNVVTTAAVQAGEGMPCVYNCILAANEFLANGGLAQAGIALLSDDCLAQILLYLASSKEDVDEVCEALPIFNTASKTNTVWNQLCRLRWSEKWGFHSRWNDASTEFVKTNPDEHFWMRKYDEAEKDSTRNFFTCKNELAAMTFDFRQWFSMHAFLNQPPFDNMRDVLPTGLRQWLAQDVVLMPMGIISSGRNQLTDQQNWLSGLSWEPNNHRHGRIFEVTLKSRHGNAVECLVVRRLPNWGWELRGSDYILRALDEGGEDCKEVSLKCDCGKMAEGTACRCKNFTCKLIDTFYCSRECFKKYHGICDDLFGDLTANIITQEKPEWVRATHRAPYPYTYREIPDDEDCKMLDW